MAGVGGRRRVGADILAMRPALSTASANSFELDGRSVLDLLGGLTFRGENRLEVGDLLRPSGNRRRR